MKISESFSGNYQYNMDAMEKYSLNMNFYPLKNVFIDYIGSFSETGFRKLYDNDDPFKGTLQEQIRHFTDFRFENDNVKAKAFCIYDEMRRDKYTEDVSEDKNKNYNYGVEGNIRFEREGVNVVIGADFVHRASDSGSQLGFHDRNDYALFSQLKISSFNRLILNLGVREQFVDGESGTRDYARFLPCLGANFNAAGHLNFFANAGKAFRAPTFNQLYYDSSWLTGNPDLEPEEGWTCETGFKWDQETIHLRLSGFYMTYRDKIELDRSGDHPFPWTTFLMKKYSCQEI